MKKFESHSVATLFATIFTLLAVAAILSMVFATANKAEIETDIIKVNFADEENYYSYLGPHTNPQDDWDRRDTGAVNDTGNFYDYTLLETAVVFFVHKHLSSVKVLQGGGYIEYINDVQFIYYPDGYELPDYFVLEINY